MNKNKTGKQALVLAGANGFLVVVLGAFGAHILERNISADMLEVFQTGVRYHMFHVLALLACALLSALKNYSRFIQKAVWSFLAGIILFSGSLYLLAVTGMTWLGMITPLGGLAFLAGWGLLIYEAVSLNDE